MNDLDALRRLAVLGGRPRFAEPLHVGRPNLPRTEALFERLRGMLDRRWLTNAGPLVREFEERVAERLGVAHCVATGNGTLALELAIRALGLHGEVVVPSFTFVATAHALQWLGIRPVFADVDPATHTLDPASVARLIGERTSAIIGVHTWGRPCAVEALEELARRHGLTVMYDAAHAFGCSLGKRSIGQFGAAEVLSFHATKVLNTFEGGAVVTNDAELAARLRLMKNFGFTGYDRVEHLGINGKMSEASAAMGLASLDELDDFIAANRRNFELYRQRLEGVPGLRLLVRPDDGRHNFHYVVAELDEAECGLSRDRAVAVLHAENILARKYFAPGVHRMVPYRELSPDAHLELPATERLAQRILVLPNGTALAPAQAEAVAELLGLILRRGHELSRLLDRQV